MPTCHFLFRQIWGCHGARSDIYSTPFLNKFLRVPTAPGKPGKTGPDLENLEKQGVLGQKPGKILQNLEKHFDLTLRKPKSLNRKNILEKKIQLKEEVNYSI